MASVSGGSCRRKANEGSPVTHKAEVPLREDSFGAAAPQRRYCALFSFLRPFTFSMTMAASTSATPAAPERLSVSR